jgi:hypothetical protein
LINLRNNDQIAAVAPVPKAKEEDLLEDDNLENSEEETTEE